MKESRPLLGMYSQTSNFSSCWMQQSRSFTSFRCWSLEISLTSFLNSFNPCPELLENLLIAISRSSSSIPWNSHSQIAKILKAKQNKGVPHHFNCLYASQTYHVNRSKTTFTNLLVDCKVLSGTNYCGGQRKGAQGLHYGLHCSDNP